MPTHVCANILICKYSKKSGNWQKNGRKNKRARQKKYLAHYDRKKGPTKYPERTPTLPCLYLLLTKDFVELAHARQS